MNPKKKILFVTYGGGHVNMIIPVVKKIQALNEFEVIVLGLTTARLRLTQEGVNSIGFKDLLQDGDDDALAYGKNMLSDVSNPYVDQEESIAYLGLSFKDLVNRYGYQRAFKEYQAKGRHAFLPLTIMQRLFKKICPDAVVATNSPRTEKAALLTANELNIPSICIVGLFAKQEVKWIKSNRYATFVCVMSEYTKKILVDAGRNPADIVITGCPTFDRLIHLPDNKANEFRRLKGWSLNEKIILWASQVEPHYHPFSDRRGDPLLPRKIEKKLINLIAKHSQWRLVIRLHPGDEIEFNNLPARVELSLRTENLVHLLRNIDVVVSMTSTVGLEAAILGKPFISVAGSVFSADAPFSELGIAYPVESLEQLESKVAHVLTKHEPAKILLPNLGCAADNIVGLIKSFFK